MMPKQRCGEYFDDADQDIHDRYDDGDYEFTTILFKLKGGTGGDYGDDDLNNDLYIGNRNT